MKSWRYRYIILKELILFKLDLHGILSKIVTVLLLIWGHGLWYMLFLVQSGALSSGTQRNELLVIYDMLPSIVVSAPGVLSELSSVTAYSSHHFLLLTVFIFITHLFLSNCQTGYQIGRLLKLFKKKLEEIILKYSNYVWWQMVTRHCGDYFRTYTNIKALRCTPETNIICEWLQPWN